MRFLATNSDLEAALAGLLKRCKRARWAVAWASSSAPGFELLTQQQSKIAQLTVGTHFYQTDPEFIAAFIEHSNAQFVLNPSGVFHPKLYYFEHGSGRWDCVVGSPNFTQAAFSSNSESAVWINQEDTGAIAAHEEIVSALDAYRTLGRSVAPEDLEAYRAVWARQQKRLGPLSGTYSPPTRSKKAPRSPLDVPIFKESWKQYFRTVKEATEHATDGRLAVLEEAARLFRKHGRFSDIDHEGRRGIAGLGRTDELDWQWFGSMKGAGYFKQAVNENNAQLSDALDRIPLTGEVGRADFDAFVQRFSSAFERSGTATATRLLAFKRPDYFVCLDSKNRKQLCEAFDIPKHVDLDDYWSKVIERIRDSNWWNAPEPSGGLERRIWRCRVAFLDVRFYSPD
jgi:HKD family nuclease